MKLYRFPIVLHPPTDGTEGRYFAEVPDIPGCHGWGLTPADAIYDVESVAQTLVPKVFADGHSLPEIAPMKFKPSNGGVVHGEVVVRLESIF